MPQKRPHPSLQIFKNPFLERFTHVHPITPLLLWAPVVLAFFIRSFTVLHLSAGSVLLRFALGLFVWTFAEYILHRWVFHFKPIGPKTKFLIFVIHDNHHEDPNDPTRLVMPPLPAIVLASLFYALFQALLGPVAVQPFFAGFLVGYLAYDYTHYAIHFFRLQGPWGKLVKRHHMDHHFIPEGAKWGVSSPFWDYVFGSMHGAKTAKKPRESTPQAQT